MRALLRLAAAPEVAAVEARAPGASLCDRRRETARRVWTHILVFGWIAFVIRDLKVTVRQVFYS